LFTCLEQLEIYGLTYFPALLHKWEKFTHIFLGVHQTALYLIHALHLKWLFHKYWAPSVECSSYLDSNNAVY